MLTASSCSSDDKTPKLVALEPFTYVAVGASETVGVGSANPAADAWTAVLFRTKLHDEGKFVNVGVSGSTVKQALEQQLPKALDAAPNLVTVWLNVNDLIRLVSPADYERDLERLVQGLRRGGAATVLVANTPRIEQLPVIRACLPNPPTSGPACRLPIRLPDEKLVTDRVDAYNAAIARVVQRQGAVLVDLHASTVAGELVAADGFHPSTVGHRRVAERFSDYVPKQFRAPVFID